MFEIYDRQLNVSPFLLLPVALANKEAAFIMGPTRLARNATTFIEKVYGFISQKGWTSPVICQLNSYSGEVLVATTIQTKVPDSDSGRTGLKFTYGALINKQTFVEYHNVCGRVFALLEQYFLSEFGFVLSLDGAAQIVTSFQRKDKVVETLLTQEKTNDLLTHLECVFFSDSNKGAIRRRINVIRNRRRIPSFSRRVPLSKLEHARAFWNNIDEKLATLNDTAVKLLKDLEEIGKLRGPGVDVNDLAKIYLQTGLREDLWHLYSRRFVEIAQTVLQQHVSLEEHERINLVAMIKLALELESKRE